MTEPYSHKIQYYETDKMGIVHHSNYIRWFEEARIDWLEQIGISFSDWESRGFASPVVSISCRFLLPMTFGETAAVKVNAVKVEAAKLELEYEVLNGNGDLCCTGQSTHCYTGSNGRPISLKRDNHEDWNRLKERELSSKAPR